jgi:NADH:ubiquinone oxidoreductase subunit 6 (subunit J)
VLWLGHLYFFNLLLFAMLGAPHFGAMSAPVLIGATVIGVGFWLGMIKRSFKIRTDAV